MNWKSTTPGLRKFTLLAHITSSVGWFGAVIPYLALAVLGLTSHDAQIERASLISMELIGWYVIVPFGLAALLSGLVQSLGTQWGLFRHWWILAKLLLTIFAVVVLFRHMEDVSRVARIVKETALPAVNFRPELIHAGGGLLVLLAAMTLSVIKPWGMTPYGRRQTSQACSPSRLSREAALANEPVFASVRPRWARHVWIHVGHAAVIVPLIAVILHLSGIHHH
jgi:hypothetical protein